MSFLNLLVKTAFTNLGNTDLFMSFLNFSLAGKCSIRNLDAVVTSVEGNNLGKNKALVFKNEWVWEVDISSGNILGGPKKIVDLFGKKDLSNKYPFKVVLYEHVYNTYLFMSKDGFVVLHDDPYFSLDTKKNYNNSRSHFRFLINTSTPLDAGFADPDQYEIYHFFRGSEYIEYNAYTFKEVTKYDYVKAINTEWPGVPSDLDAAYYNYAEKAYYFIKEDQFYKFVKDKSKLVYHSVGVLSDIFKNICTV